MSGSPSVVLDNEPASGFVSAESRLLLHNLATTGQNHPRDTPVGLLLSGAPDTTVLKNLRDVLSNLHPLFLGLHLLTPFARPSPQVRIASTQPL